MTVAPRSVGDVLAEHVVFEVDCIDRMYLNVYVPGLQYAAGLVGYVHRQLELPIASTAPLAKITDAFSTAVHRFARTSGIPWVDFAKGQRKDDVVQPIATAFWARQGRADWRGPGTGAVLAGEQGGARQLRELHLALDDGGREP